MPDLPPDQAAALAGLARLARDRGSPFRATHVAMMREAGLAQAALRDALMAPERAGRIRRTGFGVRWIEVIG